jgi:hypothetical protein
MKRQFDSTIAKPTGNNKYALKVVCKGWQTVCMSYFPTSFVNAFTCFTFASLVASITFTI